VEKVNAKRIGLAFIANFKFVQGQPPSRTLEKRGGLF
jgi:hypothetical protein